MTRPAAGRICIGLSLLATWGSFGRILDIQGTPHPRGLSALIELSFLTTAPGALVASAVFLLATGALVLRRWPVASAAVVVLLLVLGGHIQAAQWPPEAQQANRAIVLPGAALVAWIVAFLSARQQGQDTEQADATGIDAACGIAAACYTLAGLGKLLGSGMAWASGSNLSMHIMVHSYGSLPFLREFRQAVADTPALCAVAGTGTLLIECSFFLFVFPRLRRAYALAAVAMHLGIAAAMGLHHYDWMFMVLGLGLLGAPRPAS